MIGPAELGGAGLRRASADLSPPNLPAGPLQISNTYSPDRNQVPLYKRVGPRGSGKWQRISWDEATTLIATNFQQIQEKYGRRLFG